MHRNHYDTYHDTDRALHKLLLDVIPVIYFKSIKHDALDFGQCTSLNIMDHIWDTYGVIDAEQLAVNLDNIKVP